MYDNMNTELKSNVQNHNMNKQKSKNRRKTTKLKKWLEKMVFHRHTKNENYIVLNWILPPSSARCLNISWITMSL
jgi:hypothetical protein